MTFPVSTSVSATYVGLRRNNAPDNPTQDFDCLDDPESLPRVYERRSGSLIALL